MVVSILHRITGNANAVVGLPILLWWLGALVSGPEAYATFARHASSWYGLVVLVGVSLSVFSHMASGIRHFVLDLGAGYELGVNKAWSVLTPVIGIALAACFWALLLLA
jgi:succinate dehydrogenase / fumarate reductase, cytochrome b subunit